VLASILVLAAEASTTAAELLDQAAGDAEAVKNPILPTINEMFWAAIFFIALWTLMKFVLLPRITKVMDGRTDKIRDDLAAAEAAETERVAKLEQYADSLHDMGFPISQEWQQMLLMNAVRGVFPDLIDMIKLKSDKIERDELVTQLNVRYEEKLREGKLTKHETALGAKRAANPMQGQANPQAKKQKPQAQANVVRCDYCHKMGHTRAVCRFRIKDESAGIYRHDVTESAYRDNRQGPPPRGFAPRQDSRQDRYPPRGYGMSGYEDRDSGDPRDSHYGRTDSSGDTQSRGYDRGRNSSRSDYFDPPRSEGRGRSRSRSRPRSGEQSLSAIEDVCGQSLTMTDYLLSSYTLSPATSASLSHQQHEWVIDSGATRHMTQERKFFHSFSNMHGEIVVGGGHRLSVYGVGNVKLRIRARDQNNSSVITLSDVYYVPELQFNLFSVRRGLHDHITTHFISANAAELHLPDGNVIQASVQSNNYLY
jgi:F0F1-type ATP synthase membrane subunit b/b'